ncbi:MAG: hypothetical protein QW206_06150, partial [Acidilobaceae archaeon]
LSRELERTLTENIELKKEIESLRVENEKLRNASKNPELDSVKAEVDMLKKKLDDAVFLLNVTMKCLENNCDNKKLLEFLKNETSRFYMRDDEMIDILVRSMVRA